MMGLQYGRYGGIGNGNAGLWELLMLVTWISLLAFLITGTIFFWKQIKKK